jgi:hypothetical protein
VEFELSFDLDVATLTTRGAATLEGFRDGIQALVDDPRFSSGMPILVDHNELDASGMSSDDIRAIGDFTATLGERIGPSSVAVVVPNTLTFGFVRMGEAQANQPQLSVRIFYELDAAMAWLLGQPTASSAG